MLEEIQTAEELGILLDKLRALPLKGWEAQKLWDSWDEPSYFNILGEYEIEARGENHLPSDHSIIISTQQRLKIRTYQGDGRVGDFYKELRDRLSLKKFEEARQERREIEPKRQKERRKFLEFLGIKE